MLYFQRSLEVGCIRSVNEYNSKGLNFVKIGTFRRKCCIFIWMFDLCIYAKHDAEIISDYRICDVCVLRECYVIPPLFV